MACCPKCGFAVDDKDVFCYGCGNQLKEIPPEPKPEPKVEKKPEPQPEPKDEVEPELEDELEDEDEFEDEIEDEDEVEPEEEPAIEAQPPVSPPPQTQSQPKSTPYVRAGSLPLTTLKELARCPMFVIAAIAFTIVTVVNFKNAIGYSSSIFGIFAQFEGIADTFGFGSEFEDLLDVLSEVDYSLSALGSVTTLIFHAPAILTTIALWITVSAGAKKTSPTFNTNGLSIIGVLNTITLVFVTIVYIILGVIMAVAFISALQSGDSSVIVAALLSIVFVIVVATLHTRYYKRINATLNSVKYVARTGQPSRYASSYVGVICIILAIYQGVASLASYHGPSFISLCSFISTLFFGLMIFKYRKKMSRV